MSEEKADQIEGTGDKGAAPNASKVPPRESGFPPVQHRERIEDEGQPYTGHEVLVDDSLGSIPAVARGKTSARPVND